MIVFLTIVTALICALLMLVVLIQNPKGGGLDSTFGGSGANQMFGAAKSTDLIALFQDMRSFSKNIFSMSEKISKLSGQWFAKK